MWKLRSAEEGRETKPEVGLPLRTLCNLAGRQVWEYVPAEDDVGGDQTAQAEAHEHARGEYNRKREELGVKHSADELLRIQQCGPKYKDVVRVKRKGKAKANATETTAVDKSDFESGVLGGLEFYQQLQMDDGHWPGDYGGPMFLMPGLIITCYVTETMDTVLGAPHKAEMVRYLKNHQNPDGGYGLHIEGHSTMFGTLLSYVSMRLLGVDADSLECVRARVRSARGY